MTVSPTLALSLGLQGLANDLEKRLVQMTGQRQHFILLIIADGVVQHVSNTEREDSIALLHELLEQWESGKPDVPAHDNKGIK